jgi:O-methyltransferase
MSLSNEYIADIMAETIMMNREKSINLWHMLVHVLLSNVPGDIAELGCHSGLTGVILQKTMDFFKSNKELHLYDSFQGLPEPTARDAGVIFGQNDLSANEQSVFENFDRFFVKRPMVHKGWFKETLPAGLPEKIAFAYLDGDMYESIMQSLQHVYPRMSSGGIAVIDDYYDLDVCPRIETKLNRQQPTKIVNLTPGVKNACDDFFVNKPEKPVVLVSGSEAVAFFIKDKKFE